MQVSRVIVNANSIGTVRSGFSGAHTELQKEEAKYSFVFYSSSGRIKKVINVKEGEEYVIGPDWVKKIPKLEDDKYWPRRWAREFGNGCSHTSYFKLLSPGERFEYEFEGRDSYTECPVTVEKTTVKPLNGFYWSFCAVNKEWLKNATYEEFCWEMALHDRILSGKKMLNDYVAERLEELLLVSAKEEKCFSLMGTGYPDPSFGPIIGVKDGEVYPLRHKRGWGYHPEEREQWHRIDDYGSSSKLEGIKDTLRIVVTMNDHLDSVLKNGVKKLTPEEFCLMIKLVELNPFGRFA